MEYDLALAFGLATAARWLTWSAYLFCLFLRSASGLSPLIFLSWHWGGRRHIFPASRGCLQPRWWPSLSSLQSRLDAPMVDDIAHHRPAGGVCRSFWVQLRYWLPPCLMNSLTWSKSLSDVASESYLYLWSNFKKPAADDQQEPDVFESFWSSSLCKQTCRAACAQSTCLSAGGSATT